MNPLSKKNLLAIACVLALSACGSSGSGNALSVQPNTPKPEAPKSQDPAPQPQDPAPQPQDPKPQPQDPKPQPQDPKPQPQDPAPQPQDPKPQPQDPQPQPQDPKPDAGQTFGQVLGQTFAQGGAGAKAPEWMPRVHRGKTQYNGALISINNATGSISGGRSAVDQGFDSFTVDGVKILLMARASDRNSNGIDLRRISDRDFPEGGYQPRDSKNPGWMGSLGSDPRAPEFSSVRYGVYTDANNISHLFVHGTPASYLFSNGRYEYTGSAVHGKDGVYNPSRGGVRAVVDFGNKTVDFTIRMPRQGQLTVDPLRFGGTISGNTFSGTQNGVETRGGFFGTHDLGGVYNVLDGAQKGHNGVFGATRGSKLD